MASLAPGAPSNSLLDNVGFESWITGSTSTLPKKKIVPWNDPSMRVRTIQQIGWKMVWKSIASSVGALVALRISRYEFELCR